MTVDDILERQRMATQVSNDDEKKTPVQTGNGGAATSGVTPAATPANETQKGISQADARVNYSTRELVPAQKNIVPQGTSQESARVNYTTPVWARDDSNDNSSPPYNVVKTVAPTSKTDNDGDSYSSSIRRAEANRQSQMSRLVDYLNNQYPEDNETPEERKKRIRRERVAAVMSALGDGISAISNIYFTTRGANSTFNAKDGLVPKWQELYDKRVKERNDKAKDRMEALMQMYNLSKDDLDAVLKLDNNEKENARKDAEQNRKNLLATAQSLRWKAATETDEARKEYYNTQADLLERGYTLKEAESAAKVKVLNSQAEKNKAAADKDRRQGTRAWVSPSKSRGGSSGNKYWLQLPDGTTKYYANKTMYETDLDRYYGDGNPNTERSSNSQKINRKNTKTTGTSSTATQRATANYNKQRKQAAAAKKTTKYTHTRALGL